MAFDLAELPRMLRLKQSPMVRIAGGAVMMTVGVFSEEDPDNHIDFEISLSEEHAQQLAAGLTGVLRQTSA